jgi:ABC-2 type transport system permease protein
MTGLLAAELRKLTSVRTTWTITGVGLVLVAAGAGFFLFEEEFSGPFEGTDGQLAAAIDQIGGMSPIVLVIGLLAMTTEFRHGTIGRTLQFTPSRTTVVGAKLAIGTAYGVLFFVLGLVVVTLLVAVTGQVPTVGGETLASLWQGPVGLALTAMFGVALGALLRNQVVAVAVALIYLFIGETLVNQFFPEVARWMPFQALNAVFLSEESMAGMPEGMLAPLEPIVGLAVFVGYVLAFSVAAIVLMRERDV